MFGKACFYEWHIVSCSNVTYVHFRYI